MDYEEQLAKAILEMAHERVNAESKSTRPFIQPLGSGSPDKNLSRTFYRRWLMDILGIPITHRWLRR